MAMIISKKSCRNKASGHENIKASLSANKKIKKVLTSKQRFFIFYCIEIFLARDLSPIGVGWCLGVGSKGISGYTPSFLPPLVLFSTLKSKKKRPKLQQVDFSSLVFR
jgi:hypothetical protein